MAPVVTMRQLLEAGVHFGHQTRRWNPKMRRFIHGERNGIYIIDLDKTLAQIDTSYRFVRNIVADGGSVMFIGTKRQAKESVRVHAERANVPYVSERWLGGMLTNFATISKRIGKMREYQRMQTAGDFASMPKKEALLLSRELVKLERNLHGIRNMQGIPDVVFIVDTGKEAIAVKEARKLGIPVVAVVDTNCDPDTADHVIPGNDDAIRSGDLLCRIIADAVIEGRLLAEKRGTAVAAAVERTAEDEARIAGEQADARNQAAAEAAEREARVAAQAEDPAEAPAVAEEAAPSAVDAEATAPEPAVAEETVAAPVAAAAPTATEASAPPEPAAEAPAPEKES